MQRDDQQEHKDVPDESSNGESLKADHEGASEGKGLPVEGRADAVDGEKRIGYSYLFKNVLSIMGLVGMGVFGLILIFVILLDLLGVFKGESPYRGLITYIALPTLFTASLLLTVFGMIVRKYQTRKHGLHLQIVPGRTRTQQVMVVIGAVMITIAWVMLTSFGTYEAYHYTDSNEFCGKTCHTIMEPEYVAHKQSPHSHVGCVKCHIGPGANYFVRAKYRGMGQLLATYSGENLTPIKTPVESLRKAKEICAQCHWPDRMVGNVERVIVHFAADEENTMVRYNLLMKVGGGPEKTSGAHWHASEDVEVKYLALDERHQDIPYVRVKQKNGQVKEYMVADFDRSTLVESKLRTMDCLDCHNRPAHQFLSPNRLMNQAMRLGEISPALPGIKALGVKVLDAEYKTVNEALKAIDEALDGYAKEQKLNTKLTESLAGARKKLKEIYRTQFFPEHKVDYRAFIDNMGHFEYKGCERCHDGQHKSTDNNVPITHDCNACHSIIAQDLGDDYDEDEDEDEGEGEGEGEEKSDPNLVEYELTEFEHPEDPVKLTKTCSSCHALDKSEE